ESFGFDRIMFGGDWHVSELAVSYPDWVEIVEQAVAGASTADKRKLFRDNAIAFYRLDPARRPPECHPPRSPGPPLWVPLRGRRPRPSPGGPRWGTPPQCPPPPA